MMEKKNATDHLIGECYINFEKLLSGVVNINNVDDNQNVIFGETSFIEVEEKLWYCGHQVGTVKGLLSLENMPFLSQLKIGVLNNEGIQFSTNTFIRSKTKST